MHPARSNYKSRAYSRFPPSCRVYYIIWAPFVKKKFLLRKNSCNLMSPLFSLLNLLFMKKNLPPCFFFFYSIFSVLLASSQTDRFAYAITDINKEGANWSFLRKLDLKTGAFSDVLLKGNDASSLA